MQKTYNMKLTKLGSEYYLLSIEEIVSGDLCFRSGQILQATLPEIVGFANETKTQKVIASTENVDKLFLLDKNQIETLLGKVDIDKKAEEYFEKKMDNSEGFDLKHGWKKIFKESYTQALEDNADKLFTLEDMEEAIKFGVEQGITYSSIHTPDKNIFIQSITKEKTELDTEVEMEMEIKNITTESKFYETVQNNNSIGYAMGYTKSVPKVNEKGYITITSIK